MWNIKALALTGPKLLARLKFQTEWQNDRQDKNNMPPDLRSRGHKNNYILWMYVYALGVDFFDIQYFDHMEGKERFWIQIYPF